MLKISDLAGQLDLITYSGFYGLHKEITGGYVSDLLSDVMGNAQDGQVWITQQTHKNILAIASLKDLAAIILVKDHKPDEDTIQKSNEENIPVLGTELSAFEIAGRLYQLLKNELI